MRTRNRLAARTVAVLAALALTAATAAVASHPITGTWAGTWTRGDVSEITITRVEQDGAVHGAYCYHFPRFHALGVIELHPEHATAATLLGDTLRFEVGTSHIEAKLDPENPEVLVFSNRRAGAVVTFELYAEGYTVGEPRKALTQLVHEVGRFKRDSGALDFDGIVSEAVQRLEADFARISERLSALRGLHQRSELSPG